MAALQFTGREHPRSHADGGGGRLLRLDVRLPVLRVLQGERVAGTSQVTTRVQHPGTRSRISMTAAKQCRWWTCAAPQPARPRRTPPSPGIAPRPPSRRSGSRPTARPAASCAARRPGRCAARDARWRAPRRRRLAAVPGWSGRCRSCHEVKHRPPTTEAPERASSTEGFPSREGDSVGTGPSNRKRRRATSEPPGTRE